MDKRGVYYKKNLVGQLASTNSCPIDFLCSSSCNQERGISCPNQRNTASWLDGGDSKQKWAGKQVELRNTMMTTTMTDYKLKIIPHLHKYTSLQTPPTHIHHKEFTIKKVLKWEN